MAKVNNAVKTMTPWWLPNVSAQQFLSVTLGNCTGQPSMSQTPVIHWLKVKKKSYLILIVVRATLQLMYPK